MTNAVDTLQHATEAVGAQVCDTLGHEFSRGQEFLEQAWSWCLDKGVEAIVNLLVAALILLVGGFAVRGATFLVRKALRRTGRVNALLEKFLCSVVSKTGWIFLAVTALARVGLDVGPLIAGLGVTGFIFGFAFKDTLANFASGIMIALNQPFKVGDWVIVAGCEGSVLELNMMATVLATGDNRRIVIPNNAVWGGPVTNFTALERRRVDFAIGIAYGADIARACETAREALATLRDERGGGLIFPDPPPMAEVASLDDSAVTLTVRTWCRTADYWHVFFAGNRILKESFDRAGIAIPFPQLDVHLGKASD